MPSPELETNRPNNDTERRRSPSWPVVAALVGIVMTFYHGLWWPGLALVKRDAMRFFLPVKQYLVERLSAGELPQWFPYDALGRPFIGATHTGVFHPFTLLYFLMPAPDAYRVSILLSCLLAALGAFALGRLLSLSQPASLLAGIAFSLSGYIVSLTENIQYLYPICLLPFFCAAIEKALVADRVWVIAPAALWATVFLNGDIQTGYYFGFIALAWALARKPGSVLNTGLRLALMGILAVLLAGIQLGPSWTVFVGSERVHPVAYLEQALFWSTHPLRLITVLAWPMAEHESPVLVARTFFGIPVSGFLVDSLYLGVPVTGLALIGAWARRDLRILVVLGGIALVLSLGRYGGLYELFYHIVPLWSAFRYPEKLMGLVSFSAAMLAGAGLDALRARAGPLFPWLGAAVLCVLVGLGLRTDAATAWTTAHFGTAAGLAQTFTESAALAFFYSAAASLCVWLLAVGMRKQVLRESVALPVLILLVTLDLSRANLGAYHTGPVETATFVPPLVEAVQSREGTLAPGRFRLVSTFEHVLVWPEELMQRLGYYGAGSVERRQALDLEHNAAFHLESVMPYLAGYSSQLAETLNKRMAFGAAARLNVTYYIGRRYHLKGPTLARTLVAQLPPYDLALFRNPVPAKPRAYLSKKPELASAPVDPAVLFARPDFLSGEVDVIESVGRALPGPATEGSAAITRYAPEEVRVRVVTLQPAVLVLLDSFDQGWTATLDDGTDLPIMRANALVRAVVVPPGTHVVTFTYQTPLLEAGAWASLAGLGICLGLLADARRRPARDSHS